MSWLFFLRFAPEVLVSSTEAKKRWRGSGRGRWLPTDSLSVSELVHQIQSLDTLCSGERGCVVEREVLLVPVWVACWLRRLSTSPQGQNSHAQRTQPRLTPGIQASKSFCACARRTCTVSPSLSLLIYKRGHCNTSLAG